MSPSRRRRGAGRASGSRPSRSTRCGRRSGWPRIPALERWHRHGYLGTRPPSLLNPADPPPATTVPVRPVALDDVAGPGPVVGRRTTGGPAAGRRHARARCCRTARTSLDGLLDGLATLDAEIVATVGQELDPAALGERGPRVHVERWVPMSRLLATADALVFHAGSGTMLAALAAGVPLVLLPVAADQPENADRCVAAGVGIALPPDGARARTTSPARPGPSSTTRPTGPPHAGSPAEIAAMPEPAALVPRLEALAAAGADGVLSA